MDITDYLRFAGALAFVLGLIAACTFLARRSGMLPGLMRKAKTARRLNVIETRSLDARHQLALVSRDGVEHLLLLGPSGDVAVETNIAMPEAAPVVTLAERRA